MKIKLNGKYINTEYKNAFQIRDNMFNPTSIVIYNGFQINDDIQLNENDELNIINKGIMPDKDELESMMASRHTPHVHDKIKKSKVAIAGLGGLGSNIAVSLARIGVGNLLLIDFDIVEPSNLNRQSYFISDLGKFKTEALKKHLENINPFINISIKTIKIERENIKDIFDGFEIVCEAFDNAEYKSMLVSALLEDFPEIKIVASSGMAGYESSNLIKTTHPMKNLYICGDLKNESKPGMGLMAPRVQICAGHQANMVLRLILKKFVE